MQVCTVLSHEAPIQIINNQFDHLACEYIANVSVSFIIRYHRITQITTVNYVLDSILQGIPNSYAVALCSVKIVTSINYNVVIIIDALQLEAQTFQ